MADPLLGLSLDNRLGLSLDNPFSPIRVHSASTRGAVEGAKGVQNQALAGKELRLLRTKHFQGLCGSHTPEKVEPLCPCYSLYSHLSAGPCLGNTAFSFSPAHMFRREWSFSLLACEKLRSREADLPVATLFCVRRDPRCDSGVDTLLFHNRF